MFTSWLFSQEVDVFPNTGSLYQVEKKLYYNSKAHTSVWPVYLDKDSLCNNCSVYDSANYLIEKQYKNFSFIVNPVLNLSFDYDLDNTLYGKYNTGISTRGKLYRNFDYGLDFYYNKYQYPLYIRSGIDSTGIIPHHGKFIKKQDGYYFAAFNGYLSYKASDYLRFVFGKNRNFLGDGYRSLLFSENSNSVPSLKAIVDIWKVKYLVVYSKLSDINSFIGSKELFSKYSTTHYLSWNAGRNFNFTLFESVIWRGGDSLGTRGFDVNYLNPVIFFRPVEFSLGSPDNVIMGGGFKVRFLKKNHIYGQLILDEFKLKEMRADFKHYIKPDESDTAYGWWGNKYGLQFGIKCYDLFGLEGLYFQSEYNFVRPFTYTHGNSLENYGAWAQPLAHPLGANFREFISIISYNNKKWYYTAKIINAKYFSDFDNENTGGNIYQSYDYNRKEYGNYIGNGKLNNNLIIDIEASYLAKPKWNMKIFAGIRYNKYENEIILENKTFFRLGVSTSLFNNDLLVKRR